MATSKFLYNDEITTLLQAQFLFSKLVVLLIIKAQSMGYSVTLGEVFRTQYQQDYYYVNKLSKTKHSLHQDRLAIDINLFQNSQYLTENKYYEPLGQYWATLHKLCDAGSLWNWDSGHFELHYIV